VKTLVQKSVVIVFLTSFIYMAYIYCFFVWTIDLSDYPTVGPSDCRTIGLSNCRTNGLSDYSYGPVSVTRKKIYYV